ncbi:MAG: carboxypeptidase regulatory-like domain-containing protein [Betaproteobacteria bacterium]|nr:carboxypeptidase regulatory-like domain-containing protein [Betaproteobacteria bacterium]
MKSHNRMRVSKIALSLALALGTTSAFAQNTTSAIGGKITGPDGKPASGAQITILHQESGSVSNVVADSEGRYSLRGLRVGGPYVVTITKDGITERREGIYLTLAETASLDAKLGAKVQAVETIVVTGQAGASDKFSNTAMGATTSIGRDQIDAQASIQRNLQDYARVDPRLSQTDKERGEISAGGQNTRYNSVTIDGVTTNDTFGLEANNLPTAKQPISIDAIQSVQVNVSNYDVSQKGYTGANINAVTKSGTNQLKGSVYYVFRDDKLVGDRYNRTNGTYFAAPTFEESTKGMTLGGPIIKDKLFFFVSYEELASTRNAPAFGALGSANNNVAITQSSISGARDIANTTYSGLNIGTSDVPSGTELKVKDYLLKLDWNISAKHRANLRYAKTEQTEPIFPGLFATGVSLNSHWYKQEKEIETIVGQWFADWTPTFSTEAKISKRDYDSVPNNNSRLPLVTLNFTGALPAGAPSGISSGTRSLIFGTERSRHFNILKTETTDGYVGANWQLGDHEVKFGGDFSKNDVYNAFLQDVNGNYTFSCVNSSATYTYSFGAITCGSATTAQIEQAVLENFRLGRPSAYQVQVPVTGGTLNNAVAQFSLKNYGGFLQDTWTINPNLTVMYGARIDVPEIGNRPLRNDAAAAPLVAGNAATGVRQSGGFGRDNTVTIDGQDLFQPRVGFNYTFDSERPMQLRGGVGLFQGAAANVWLSNPFSNSGVATRVIGCGTLGFAACPATGGIFSSNPSTQPTNFTGATPAANVDYLVDGLGQPSVWKANLGFEHELPYWGLVFSAEYLYTQTKTGIYYQHLNLGAPSRFSASDGRELFYTAAGFNANCWNANGTSITTGTGCTDFRSRALSNPNFNNVLLANKTDKGRGNLATLSLSRPVNKGWGWSLAYTYSDATEVSPLTSSVANSNWAGRSVFNPNEEVAANSAYLTKNRLNGSISWQHSFFKGYKTQIGLFAEARSGKPYSWTFINDLNGDGLGGNDLMYIPRGPGSGEVVFRGDTGGSTANEDRFWQIVSSNHALNKARGGVVERNSEFAPWTTTFDMRISQELPGIFKGNKAVFVLDLLNVGNMINKKWGRIDEIGFQSNGASARSFVNYAGLDSSGRYIYSVGNLEDFVTRQERGESQWAVQATFRYEF